MLDMTPPKDAPRKNSFRKSALRKRKSKRRAPLHLHAGPDGANPQWQRGGRPVPEITTISYDDKGKRLENVTFAEQSTLRGISLSAEDMDDVRRLMPLILTTEDLPLYNVTYAGQQHVDDLDTYVFHVEPKKEEKDKRYFQGRIWVDSHDLQIVKLCGKSVPEIIRKKKNQPQDVRPTFVGYRQPVEGLWFPAYVRVDDTLHFRVEAMRVREILKFTGYKRVGVAASAKP